MNNLLPRDAPEKRIAELEEQVARLQSEAVKYRTLFNAFPHGITISDPGGNIIESNAAAEKLLGVSKAEHEKRAINGKEWRILRPDGTDMPPEEWASVIALKENRTVAGSEMGICRPDGQISWIQVTAAPLPLETLGVVVTYNNITEKKHAEERLKNSRQQFETLFEAIPLPVFFKDTEGRYLGGNPAFCAFIGKSRDEFTGKTVYDIAPGDIADQYFKKDRELLEHPGQQLYEWKVMSADGRLRDVLFSKATFHTARGETEGIIGVIIDITYRKRAEQALKESEEELKRTLDATTDGIWAWDFTTDTLWFSSKYYTMLGYAPDEFPADFEHWLNLVHPDDRDRALSVAEAYLKTRPDEYDNEFRLRTKQGDYRWIHAHARVVKRDEQGNALYMIGNHEDITLRKQAEEAFRELEIRFQQSQKMEAIGTLAGGIAHDFNNILFPITGYAEMLRDDLSAEGHLRGYVNEILHAAMRAKDLVNQILAFSRQNEEELKPIRLQPIIKETIKLLRASIPSTIDVRQDIDPDCGVVVADPSRIHQVLMNLAANAFHAMEKAGGALTVSLKQMHPAPDQPVSPELPPGPHVCLSVSDTGVGMTQEMIDKIFDPYFTTKEKGKGTGLGLSVVHGIVKGCRGDIRVVSAPGKGARFDIFLPGVDSTMEADAPENDAAVPGGYERILFVDDELPIANLGRQMIEKLGYAVTVRTSSVDALALFKADPHAFDLVITDLTMPNITGDRLASELKRIRADIPVILYTGYSKKISKKQAGRQGLDALVHKPLLKKDLAATIRRLLDHDPEAF